MYELTMLVNRLERWLENKGSITLEEIELAEKIALWYDGYIKGKAAKLHESNIRGL